MGAILAKFKKDKTTYQILEKLEGEIKDLEAYTVNTQARQKRLVGNLLVISIGLYVIGFIIFYFLFYPPTWPKRIIYSTPLLIFPIVIIFLKRILAMFFERKLSKNSVKLSTLRSEKKQVLENAMDKETYKVAVDILNRFGDQSIKSQPSNTIGALSPRTPLSSTTPNQHTLVNRNTAAVTTTAIQGPQQLQQLTPLLTGKNLPRQIHNTPNRFNINDQSYRTPTSIYSQSRQLQSTQRQHTPYPIINQNEKGVLEKMVDYLIGDGVNNRFGMVCKECYGHNGMASQEDYEYSAFRCAFCKVLNPARKLRPIAPKLNFDGAAAAGSPANSLADLNRKKGDGSSTSPSEKDSGSDSESSQTSSTAQQNNKTDENKSDERLTTATSKMEEIVKGNDSDDVIETNKSSADKKNE